MMEAASKREFDVLLFWSIDRFSKRRYRASANEPEGLSEYGVRYRSFQESFIDTTTSEFGDLLAAFVAKIAELEGKRIQQRVKAGLAHAKEQGKVLGRPKANACHERVRTLRDRG